jgi:hypothetical protein
MNKNKFRIWNYKYKAWDNLEDFTLDDPIEFSHCCKFQQFTGALDKKNKQIFEGDTVLWENPDPYDNQESLTMIVGYNTRAMGYKLYNFPEDVGNKSGRHFFPEEVEVIGNIFEGAAKDGVNYGEWLVEK